MNDGAGLSAYHLQDIQTKLKQGVEQDPVVALVDEVLLSAIKAHASDIHLEPSPYQLRVRFRIDGVLYDQDIIATERKNAVVSRLKVLSHMDIAEHRIAQDGKFRVFLGEAPRSSLPDSSVSKGRVIDLRMATFPSLYGEKMVIRILDRSQQSIALESLGFSQQVLESVMELVKRPHGLFLTTGPTGSGKTTTLYALLSRLNTSERNIVTMEDPVEYNLDGITQSQVNVKAGFTFDTGLRSMLRQDPDIAMIGEIRDAQTVQIAMQAALTGHLVLSTLHTNNASGAVTRLIDMGIEPFLISASLVGVLAQRLVRLLCQSCKEPRKMSKSEQQRAAAYGWNIGRTWSAKGCIACMNTGYKGRVGIFELLMMTDTIADMIMQRTSARDLEAQAIAHGMLTLSADALTKVKTGLISFEEFLKVMIQ